MSLNIDILSPKVSETLKLKKKEELIISIAVNKKISPKNFILELWSSIQDKNNKVQSAITIPFKEKKGDRYFFEKKIKVPHTGYFELSYRYRKKSQKYWEWYSINNSKVISELWVDPDWISDAIVYNAFVRFFGSKSVKDNQIKATDAGKFQDVRKELKKLKNMGVNVLYLNPVHSIGELYRNYNPHDLMPGYLQPGCPYSVKDYKSIDPQLSLNKKKVGDSEHPFSEFKKMVDTAHKLGIRVIMDLVFNHSAHDSVFQRIHPEWYLYKETIDNLEEPYLYPEDLEKNKPWGDAKHTFSPYDHGYWWKDAAQLNWNNIDSYPDFIMPKTSKNSPPLNPTINDMYNYFKGIVNFWIKEFGIDGFRCDVAYRVPLDFWKSCIIEARNVAKKYHPKNNSVDGDVVFIAEDYHVDMKGLLEAGFTACYGDYSNKLVNVPDLKGYLDYMYNLSGDYFPKNSEWFIFPECHDFHRTPDKIAKNLRQYHKDADLNANKSRWTLTCCLPGIPMIFNGFEKIEWEPFNLFSYQSIDWESDKDISNHIKKVNLIRRKQIALQKGNYTFLYSKEGLSDSARLFAFARTYKQECIIIVINLDVANKFSSEIYLSDDLPKDFKNKYILNDLLNKKKYEKRGNKFTVILEPGEAHIFKVEQKFEK